MVLVVGCVWYIICAFLILVYFNTNFLAILGVHLFLNINIF